MSCILERQIKEYLKIQACFTAAFVVYGQRCQHIWSFGLCDHFKLAGRRLLRVVVAEHKRAELMARAAGLDGDGQGVRRSCGHDGLLVCSRQGQHDQLPCRPSSRRSIARWTTPATRSLGRPDGHVHAPLGCRRPRLRPFTRVYKECGTNTKDYSFSIGAIEEGRWRSAARPRALPRRPRRPQGHASEGAVSHGLPPADGQSGARS